MIKKNNFKTKLLLCPQYPFKASVPFLYPPKTMENPWFFYDFIMYKKGTSLREKYQYSKFFWSVLSHIQIEYGEIRSISPYSVWMRGNSHQKNSEYEHFSRSAWAWKRLITLKMKNQGLNVLTWASMLQEVRRTIPSFPSFEVFH